VPIQKGKNSEFQPLSVENVGNSTGNLSLQWQKFNDHRLFPAISIVRINSPVQGGHRNHQYDIHCVWNEFRAAGGADRSEHSSEDFLRGLSRDFRRFPVEVLKIKRSFSRFWNKNGFY
jgi:hypothetical protein